MKNLPLNEFRSQPIYAEREDNIEKMATKLKKKHGDEYSYPQYKLWARLITWTT